MFRGGYIIKRSKDGSFNLPLSYCNIIANSRENKIVVSNKDDCLYCYTLEEWEQIERRILSAKQKSMIPFKRFFLGNSTEIEVGKHGRISIPKNLSEYASLKETIIILGNLDRFEIWAKEKHDTGAFNTTFSDPDNEQLNQLLRELGII